MTINTHGEVTVVNFQGRMGEDLGPWEMRAVQMGTAPVIIEKKSRDALGQPTWIRCNIPTPDIQRALNGLFKEVVE